MSSSTHTFFCLDGHTCGNPVRLVAGGAPHLVGATMSEKRQDFLQNYDWMRRSLMFEPRGHDLMSGAFLYPPMSDDADISVLFIETSGCLPMCGHGLIGVLTMGIEHGLIKPSVEGWVMADTPAGPVKASFRRENNFVEEVRFRNIQSYLAAQDIEIDCPGLGRLTIDVAYGGNFYAILDPQDNYAGLETISAEHILRYSPIIRELVQEAVAPVHLLDETIQGVSHVMWTGSPKKAGSHGRNAVFYGDKAIDRSPCGTGTSARMAQLTACGRLAEGDEFVHESIIGSVFGGRVEAVGTIEGLPCILPSIAGWARMTGINTITVDERDPFWRGFQVT